MTGDFVGSHLVELNIWCGVPVGVAIFLLSRGGPLLARALRAAVVGGYLGALVGSIDVAFLSDCFQPLNSDLVGAWRDNRSLLVIMNAAGTAMAGALASFRGLWLSGLLPKN
jgi:hypothetical protein